MKHFLIEVRDKYFLLCLYINDYLTFKKSENKRWSLACVYFFSLFDRRRQAAKV
jgi:hypothetical protein